MKIRLVVEYDLDVAPGYKASDTELADELTAWLKGSITVADVQQSADQGDISCSVRIGYVEE